MTEKGICLIYKTDTLSTTQSCFSLGEIWQQGKKSILTIVQEDKFKSRVHSLDGNPHVKEKSADKPESP